MSSSEIAGKSEKYQLEKKPQSDAKAQMSKPWAVEVAQGVKARLVSRS